MLLFDGYVLYGLTPEFDRAMRMAILVSAAIYLVYPMGLALAWFAWRKERGWIAGGLLAAVMVVGVGVPVVDQARHSADKRAVLAAELRANELDVAGQHVVVLRRVCADLCKWLLRYGEVERLTLVTATREERAVFAQTGYFPPDTQAFSVQLDGLSAIKTAVDVETVKTGETLVIRREPGGLIGQMPTHYPRSVAAEHIWISTYVAPSSWGRPLDDWAPVILTLIHKDQAFSLPLHPFARTNRPTADFRDESRYLSDLLCPWPHGELGRVCSKTAKP